MKIISGINQTKDSTINRGQLSSGKAMKFELSGVRFWWAIFALFKIKRCFQLTSFCYQVPIREEWPILRLLPLMERRILSLDPHTLKQLNTILQTLFSISMETSKEIYLIKTFINSKPKCSYNQNSSSQFQGTSNCCTEVQS